MITPTVGRIVHFYPGNASRQAVVTPLAAIITRVWSDTEVGLTIFAQNGVPLENPPLVVKLVQPEEDPPKFGCYCAWMLYQVKKDYGSESGEKKAGTQKI